MARDRAAALKAAAHRPQYGQELLKPSELAKRFTEAGPELKTKILADMRKDKDGMTQVLKFQAALNRLQGQGEAQPMPQVPQINFGGQP